MPYCELADAQIYYEDTGKGDIPIVFSHGLFWSTRLYDAQVAALKKDFRCIAYDHRGQGKSLGSRNQTVSLDQGFEDAVQLIEKLDLGPCHFVGLSMGGYVGLRVAARRPDLVRSLALLASAAGDEPPENLPGYRLLNWLVHAFGMEYATSSLLPILFGKTFLGDPTREAIRAYWVDELRKNDRGIYHCIQGILERESMLDFLPKISVPTLILVGEEDVATPPTKAERLAAALPHAHLTRIPAAGHTLAVEAAEQVTDALKHFFEPTRL